MNKRFKELKERLIAVGRPADHFSCSELHELYDEITKLENSHEEFGFEISRLKADKTYYKQEIKELSSELKKYKPLLR